MSRLEPFGDLDWQAFAGCESDEPLIGYDDFDQLVVVVDGRSLCINHIGGAGQWPERPDAIPSYAYEAADHDGAIMLAEELLADASLQPSKAELAAALFELCGDPVAYV